MQFHKSKVVLSRQWPFAVGLIAVVLATLFYKCLLPGYVQFSNDGPLGQQMPNWIQLPQGFTGMWDDMNYIGFNGGGYQPSVSAVLRWFLGAVGYSKFYAPAALLILGFGAWTFFRVMGLAPAAALIGGLVAALNSAFFSTACWGVASQQIAAGFDFMAMALVVSLKPGMPFLVRWARIILAGMAVGVNVMEAADIGALYSMFVAAFALYYFWISSAEPVPLKIFRGAGRVAVIAISAVFIAAFSVTSLVGTSIKGVAGMHQDSRSKEQQWDWATQWSLPKRETASLIVSGLYGYRMDTPDGGNYWGAVGRDAAWYRYFENGKQGPAPDPNTQFLRFSGGGCYLGVTAVLMGFWAIFQSFCKKSVFSPAEKKLIWFFAATLVVTLPLAYGRFAQFYRFFYQLPYFSTMRNPAKFLNLFVVSMLVLTAYGIEGLFRGYVETSLVNFPGLGARLKNWWAKAPVFDRRWTLGCVAAIGFSFVGLIIYASSQHSLEQYLQEVMFDQTLAHSIAAFSICQVGWYVLFLTLGAGLIVLIMSGALAGQRAKYGAILIGVLLAADLWRADRYWVLPVNYVQKNAANEVLDFLATKPYEHRVAILPFRAPPQYGLFDEVYRLEWAQHHFHFYNIQSLDVVQMPRIPEDLAAFEDALIGDGTTNTLYKICRRWELTNTRYLLGAAGFLDVLNEQLDPARHRFRIAKSFDILPKPGVDNPTQLEELTAVINTNGAGQYAVFDFTGALPRVKLYSNWLTNSPANFTTNGLRPAEMRLLGNVGTNDFLTLRQIASESFDPSEAVIVAGGISSLPNPADVKKNPGTVEFESYAPKHLVLKTRSEAPTVLLLNDRYDPNWRVRVDGRPAELLRCNFLMRGVQVPAGSHRVEFIFQPDIRTLYVSLTAIGTGILLVGIVVFDVKTRESKTAAAQTPASRA